MDQPANLLSPPAPPGECGCSGDGQSIPTGDRKTLLRARPRHSVPAAVMPRCAAADADRAIVAKRRAFFDRPGSGFGGANRAAIFPKGSQILRRLAKKIAHWGVLETGRSTSQARTEVGGCVGMYEFASGLAGSPCGGAFNGHGVYGVAGRDPVVVVGTAQPWRIPFPILCERVSQVLAPGNILVMKPAVVAPTKTLILAEILSEAGLPDDVLNLGTWATAPSLKAWQNA